MGRGGETQLRVGGNLKRITWRVKGKSNLILMKYRILFSNMAIGIIHYISEIILFINRVVHVRILSHVGHTDVNSTI